MMNFITGLPHSGIDILTKLLQQNKKIGIYEKSPLFNISKSIIDESLSQGGYNTQCDENMRKKLISSVVQCYTDHELIFDVNYKWNYQIPVVADLNGKVICMVRSITEILNAHELDFFKNPYQKQDGSVYSRCRDLLSGELGDMYNSVKHISNYPKGNIMIIEYDYFIKNAGDVMTNIYNFLKIDKFEHTYNEIIVPNEYNILPFDILEQYANLEVWRVNHLGV